MSMGLAIKADLRSIPISDNLRGVSQQQNFTVFTIIVYGLSLKCFFTINMLHTTLIPN